MSASTLAELKAPLLVLRLLSAEFGHLPAPHVLVSAIFPDLLELSFHDDLAAFEAWREALGMLPEAVNVHELESGRSVLTAEMDYGGARVRLTGYGRIVASAGSCSRGETGS
ncbi:hypothetical protein AB0G83_28940 [Streptomyces klenkii]|uniref:hypothetical protein n=1 Tax=Streptomyces klenkii TaxID=1420899 RepID=UPI0033E97F09